MADQRNECYHSGTLHVTIRAKDTTMQPSATAMNSVIIGLSLQEAKKLHQLTFFHSLGLSTLPLHPLPTQ